MRGEGRMVFVGMPIVDVDAVILDVAQIEGVARNFTDNLHLAKTAAPCEDAGSQKDEKLFHSDSFLMVTNTSLPLSILLRILW